MFRKVWCCCIQQWHALDMLLHMMNVKFTESKGNGILTFSWSQRREMPYALSSYSVYSLNPSLCGRCIDLSVLLQVSFAITKKLREEYNLIVCLMLLMSAFWTIFYLLSSVTRKCLLPVYLQIYFSSLQWKLTLFIFWSYNTFLCFCWVKVSVSLI
jgi:hypothetical protein